MPWVIDHDGLTLSGVSHYNIDQIRQSVEELRQTRQNGPETLCKELEGLLESGTASKSLVRRLSKWCDWSGASEKIARLIASELFHGVICRRLLDDRDKPIPDRATADVDYETWRHRVADSRRCIDYYGARCSICGFDFALAYDGIGDGMIHVHHLVKLADIRKEYQIDPIRDLRPVCPNCHLVIHLYKHPFSIDEVKAMLSRSRERCTFT